jgi:ABC-type multidrug transport system ATPase subunit/ABC-type multidrug transport system permease subunit
MGEVHVNGKPREDDFAQRVAYVMQEELLFAFLSVQETLMLHARLRLPPNVPDAEKQETVRRLIAELGLKNVADSPVGRVGGFPRGLSGGERKRCNIAVEMVRDPAAIFLDEPTSGLDSFQAQNVMGALRDLARSGRTVVCTIHQPRSSIFAMFDQLMLLTDGRLVYIGDAHDSVDYFETLHFRCPNLTNPADFFMDVTSVDYRGESREGNSRERVAVFALEAGRRGLGAAAVTAALTALQRNSHGNSNSAGERGDDGVDGGGGLDNAPNGAVAEAQGVGGVSLDGDRQLSASRPISGGGGSGKGGGAGWLYQFRLLLSRAHKCQKRDVVGVGITYALDIMYALLLSALFRGVRDDQEGVQARVGCLFFIVLNSAYSSALPSINLFAGEKGIVIREQASGAYSASAYYLSKLVAELPKLSSKLVFCTVVYWIVGFNPAPARFFLFVVIVWCEVLAAQAIGMVMATGMPIGAALALGPAFITIFTLFGGIFLNMDSIPQGAGWIRYVDFIYYAFSALCANEFNDSRAIFRCGEEDTRCLPDGTAVLELYSFEHIDVGMQIGLQLVLAFGLQLMAFRLLVRNTGRFMPLSMDKESDQAREDREDREKGPEGGLTNINPTPLPLHPKI